MWSSLGEIGLSCCREVSTHKYTNPPSQIASLGWGQKKRVEMRRVARRKSRERGERKRASLFPAPPPTPGLPHPSPPFTAAVPAVGAGLAPLRGGHILLSVLGGGGRAGPFANLSEEEEIKTHSRAAPEPVLPRARPRKLKQLPCLISQTCFQALMLPGQGFHSRAAQSQGAPETAWLRGEAAELLW